ncbi:putative Vegetative incompatibility protein HET-E-1 [Blattamonas nauphoetae]|uniref:Vegetative incompatibility protein HET-E-1 n=1 Tax=Blattamonas nauphoetae TaxID=2049346 RepID=A0ABQ9XXP1_9EUKA|nr:putative Vegetative incompatibility protein HET-E-1 [Blattamonas nauphoetae]
MAEMEDEEIFFEDIPFEMFSDAPGEGEGEQTLAELEQKLQKRPVTPPIPETVNLTPVSSQPVVVEDYIRNYLRHMRMYETLDKFQTEWYATAHDSTTDPVVDAYAQIRDLQDQVLRLKEEIQTKVEFAEKASALFEKLRKERDFHKMHHRRVVEEKNKLIRDMKRLVKHNANYEPALREMKQRYESAMKDKMLIKLERDKFMNRVEILEETLRQLQSQPTTTKDQSSLAQQILAKSPLQQQGQTRLLQHTAASKQKLVKPKKKLTEKEQRQAELKKASKPLLNMRVSDQQPDYVEPATKAAQFKAQKTFQAHQLAITSVCLHPSKDICVTTSDDTTWKMWSLPNGELIMSGEGHRDWVARASFHPGGLKLATASGDCTVKLWDFATAACEATLSTHSAAVFSVSYHESGDYLASCSMDNTIRIYDANTAQEALTLRGHVDSVNDICFLPQSTLIGSCSSDKTVSLWDVRTGQCVQTFVGHANSCNRIASPIQSDALASSDADGIVELWDIRTVQQRGKFNCGESPANGVSFDGSGQILSVGCDDGSIKIINIEEEIAAFANSFAATSLQTALSTQTRTLQHTQQPTVPVISQMLTGHNDQVLDVLFEKGNRYLLSTSADRSFKFWC